MVDVENFLLSLWFSFVYMRSPFHYITKCLTKCLLVPYPVKFFFFFEDKVVISLRNTDRIQEDLQTLQLEIKEINEI